MINYGAGFTRVLDGCMVMGCCSGECLWRCLAWSLVLGALGYLGIQSWLKQKSYVFHADELAAITNDALRKGMEISFNTETIVYLC